jgi:hypothetical protein
MLKDFGTSMEQVLSKKSFVAQPLLAVLRKGRIR